MVQRRRLGELVRRRRRELGLSVLDAARLASVNRNTWDALEGGTRQTRDHNFAGIERALQWKHGSVEAILDGGEPGEAEPAAVVPDTDRYRYTDPVTGEDYLEPWERELWDLTTYSADERRELIYYIRSKKQREQAERRRAA